MKTLLEAVQALKPFDKSFMICKSYGCPHCESDITHTPECPVTQLREVLSEPVCTPGCYSVSFGLGEVDG